MRAGPGDEARWRGLDRAGGLRQGEGERERASEGAQVAPRAWPAAFLQGLSLFAYMTLGRLLCLRVGPSLGKLSLPAN